MIKKRKRSSRLERHSCIVYIKNAIGVWERYTSNMSKENHIIQFNVDFAVGLLSLDKGPETHIELRSSNFGYGIILHEPKVESIPRVNCSELILKQFFRRGVE